MRKESDLDLAINITSNPGVYALLLGSGVSRSANIPTGWEVIVKLIQKLMIVNDAEEGIDPEEWYRSTYGKEPDYSAILEELSPSPAERHAILRPFFEATGDELDHSDKRPTKAHRAIAQMAKNGLLRVILTTNFDRLIEVALNDLGIYPQVIASSDQIDGTLPLAHQQCLVVKIHGDYLDTRIRNTANELSGYDAKLRHLLMQVFNEFGLLICGWSGDWDGALRSLLSQANSRRFTTYWASRSKLSELAERLLTNRSGKFVRIADADTFFDKLSSKTEALLESEKPHPASANAATSYVKKLLSRDEYRIELEDFLEEEAMRSREQITRIAEAGITNKTDPIDYHKLLASLFEATEIIRNVMYVGCRHARLDQVPVFLKALKVISSWQTSSTGQLEKSYDFPPLVGCMILYSVGTLGVLVGNERNAAKFIGRATVLCRGEEELLVHAADLLSFNRSLRGQLSPLRRPVGRSPRVLSNFILERIKVELQRHCHDIHEFENAFDFTEAIICLARFDERRQKELEFVGRFVSQQRINHEEDILTLVEKKAKNDGENWAYFQAGLFRQDINYLVPLIGKYRKMLQETTSR